MYIAHLSHELELGDIKKGIEFGKIKSGNTTSDEDYMCVLYRGSSKGTNVKRIIYFHKEGEIRSEGVYGVKKGIELLKEIGIVLPNLNPPIQKV